MNLRNGDKIHLSKFITSDGTKYYYIDGNGQFAEFNTGSVGSAIDITYEALVALRDASSLESGSWYRITDYNSTNLLHGVKGLSNTTKKYIESYQSPTEVLLVEAISSSKIASIAKSESFTEDIIFYDLDYNSNFVPSTQGEINNFYQPTLNGFGFDSEEGKVYFDLPLRYDTSYSIGMKFYWNSGANFVDVTFEADNPITTGTTPSSSAGEVTTCTVSSNGDRIYFDNLNSEITLDSSGDYGTEGSLRVSMSGALYTGFKGSITKRVDPLYDVEMGIDWRNVKYRRYEVDGGSIPFGTAPSLIPFETVKIYRNGTSGNLVSNGTYHDYYIIGSNNTVGGFLNEKGDYQQTYRIQVGIVDNLVMKKDTNSTFQSKNVIIGQAHLLQMGDAINNLTIDVSEINQNDAANLIIEANDSVIGNMEAANVGFVNESNLINLRNTTLSGSYQSNINLSQNTLISSMTRCDFRDIVETYINSIERSRVSYITASDFDDTSMKNLRFDSIVNTVFTGGSQTFDDCRGGEMNNCTFNSLDLEGCNIENVDFGHEYFNNTHQGADIINVKFTDTHNNSFNSRLRTVTFLGTMSNSEFVGDIEQCLFKGDFYSGNGQRLYSSSTTPVLASESEFKEIYRAGSWVKVVYYAGVSPETLSYLSITETP